jgi:hypothetical protein
MKFILFILLSGLPGLLYAQEGFVSKLGFGAGYSIYRIFPKFGEINPLTKNYGVGKFPSSGMCAGGIGGFIYLPVIENFRIGAYKYSGTEKLKGTVDGYSREADYSSSAWAVTLEYSLPWTPGFALSAGLGLGSGSTELELFSNKGISDWETIPAQNSQNIYRKMYVDYFTLTPMVNVDIPVHKFIVVRAGAGYQMAFGGAWKADNDIEIKGVPGGAKDNSFYIQTGIYIGFLLL